MAMETRQEWLEFAGLHQDRLRDLLEDYHPSSSNRKLYTGPISAPVAEMACETVRGRIAQQEKVNPVEKFTQALADKDVSTLAVLLDGAWFGVPESTECWRIPGFTEAVTLLEAELLENLPEGEEAEVQIGGGE